MNKMCLYVVHAFVRFKPREDDMKSSGCVNDVVCKIGYLYRDFGDLYD